MSYCLNPVCSKPQNSESDHVCQNCGSPLILRGRYRATSSLGQGGFGRTYKAIDLDRLNSVCVIKQFLPKLQDAKAISKATELFNQEAIRLYELGEHPQIPSLLAFFVEGERQYLVQDFVSGNNLLKELELEGPFGEAKVWALWRDILPVLQFVHERQVIHRDIKPENIIRREADQRLVLIDFGVAKVLDQAARNASVTTIGSPGYMPMELLVDGKVYPASDLYGLGITSFHLLTMVSPQKLFIKYGFSWLTKWRKCLKQPVSAVFAGVLDRLICEDYRKRYQSAGEVIEDIQRLAEGQPQTSNVASNMVRSPKVQLDQDQEFIEDFLRDLQQSPKPRLQSQPDDTEGLIDEILMDIQTAVTYIEGDTLKSIQTDHEVAEALADEVIDQFLKDIKATSMSSVSFLEDEINVAGALDSTNLQEWACLYTLQAHSTGVGNLVFGSDRKTLISVGKQRSAKSWNYLEGRLLKTIIDADTCATCSGSGKVQRVTRMLVVETVQNTTCPDCAGFGKNPERSERFVATAFSPGGTSLAIASPDQKIKLFEIPSGRLLRYLSEPLGQVSALAFSSNRQILAVGGDRLIQIWHLDKDRLTLQLSGHQGDIGALAITLDNQALISASSDRTIKVWNLKTGQIVRTLVGHQKAVTSLAFNRDGTQLVSGSRDRMVKIWNWQTGKHLLNLEGHSGGITSLCFSSDGVPLLASGSSDGSINIWHLGRKELVNILVEHTQAVSSLCFSPSGQHLVSGSEDKTLKVWRVF